MKRFIFGTVECLLMTVCREKELGYFLHERREVEGVEYTRVGLLRSAS